MARLSRKAGERPDRPISKADGGERPAIDSRPAADTDDLDVIATARAAVTRRIFQGPAATLLRRSAALAQT